MVFFRDEGRNAVANAERETIFACLYVVADHCKQVSVVCLMGGYYGDVLVKTIAEIVAQEVLRLDAHVELRMMKVNGLAVRIVDGEINVDGIAMMEDWNFGFIAVCDAQRRHQAVGRLEMLRHKPMKFNAIDLICLG